LVNWL